MNEETGGTILQLQAEVRRLKEALEKYRGEEDTCAPLVTTSVWSSLPIIQWAGPPRQLAHLLKQQVLCDLLVSQSA